MSHEYKYRKSLKLSDEERANFKRERKEKINQIRKTLSLYSEAERESLAERYGIVTVEGHQLSPYNQCFLIAQSNINFSIVGGFKQWRKSGRSVKKGEHGFLILVPAKPRESVPMGKEEHVQVVDDYILSDEDIRFYSATVFDISQTEPLENAKNKLKTE